jgi:hypothetical protein
VDHQPLVSRWVLHRSRRQAVPLSATVPSAVALRCAEDVTPLRGGDARHRLWVVPIAPPF